MLARLLLTACLVMTGLLSATTASARELRMAFDEVPATLDIHEQLSLSVLQLSHISFDPLIRWTRELSFEPRLATSFQRLDETTVRFKLRCKRRREATQLVCIQPAGAPDVTQRKRPRLKCHVLVKCLIPVG